MSYPVIYNPNRLLSHCSFHTTTPIMSAYKHALLLAHLRHNLVHLTWSYLYALPYLQYFYVESTPGSVPIIRLLYYLQPIQRIEGCYP